MMRALIVASAFTMALPGAAQASLLTKDSAARLCVVAPDGRKQVNPDRLALAVVSEAQALAFLDGANAEGWSTTPFRCAREPTVA